MEKTYGNLRKFKGGNALFNLPPMPIKCPGAPQKIMYLVDDYLRLVRLHFIFISRITFIVHPSLHHLCTSVSIVPFRVVFHLLIQSVLFSISTVLFIQSEKCSISYFSLYCSPSVLFYSFNQKNVPSLNLVCIVLHQYCSIHSIRKMFHLLI